LIYLIIDMNRMLKYKARNDNYLYSFAICRL
jgi:hypothetical protein